MGSSDLNMKKSWHPQTLANQRRVAEEKHKAEEEAKRVAKIQKELREERQREEMDQLNASVTQKSINKLEWMYSAPSTGMPQTSEEMEEYLLGKRDAMSLLKDKDARENERLTRKPDDKWKEGLFAFSNRDANSERDAIAKTMEDPLAEIKRREHAAVQTMLGNPLNRKRLGLYGRSTGGMTRKVEAQEMIETDIDTAEAAITSIVERMRTNQTTENAQADAQSTKKTREEEKAIVGEEIETAGRLRQPMEAPIHNENVLVPPKGRQWSKHCFA
ncbi:RNA-splicing factor [Coemansia sp. IMI 209127]|nr:RNA-splicing factor [Coemansia sp. IMI 209127]